MLQQCGMWTKVNAEILKTDNKICKQQKPNIHEKEKVLRHFSTSIAKESMIMQYIQAQGIKKIMALSSQYWGHLQKKILYIVKPQRSLYSCT